MSDNQPILEAIAALAAGLTRRDSQLSALSEQLRGINEQLNTRFQGLARQVTLSDILDRMAFLEKGLVGALVRIELEEKEIRRWQDGHASMLQVIEQKQAGIIEYTRECKHCVAERQRKERKARRKR